MPHSNYIGRFAPSPSGHLHFGSLVTAVASYFQAKSHHGKWLVRIENIDVHREIAGAADSILQALEAHLLLWDDEVVYQHQRLPLYQEAINDLLQLKIVYRCQCSRKIIQRNNIKLNQLASNVYPGTCRTLNLSSQIAHTLRLGVTDHIIEFNDLLQGNQRVTLSETGDFVIRQADLSITYQLAVAIDDKLQHITEVVRGRDLIDSSARQIHILQLLHHAIPQYCHIPVVRNTDGSKLSKQTGAQPLSLSNVKQQLWNALDFLNQKPPLEFKTRSILELHNWALQEWDINKIRS